LFSGMAAFFVGRTQDGCISLIHSILQSF
jgi:hypothetical protein